MYKWQCTESLTESIVGITTLFLESVQITTNVYAQERGLRHIHVDVCTKVELLVVGCIVHQQTLILLQDTRLLEIRGND